MLQKDSSTLLVAGHQGIMLEVDLNRGKVTKEVHVRFLVIYSASTALAFYIDCVMLIFM